jgi:hypothetical protein
MLLVLRLEALGREDDAKGLFGDGLEALDLLWCSRCRRRINAFGAL